MKINEYTITYSYTNTFRENDCHPSDAYWNTETVERVLKKKLFVAVERSETYNIREMIAKQLLEEYCGHESDLKFLSFVVKDLAYTVIE